MYNILEVANTHAGSIEYIYSLLNEFEEFKKGNGFGIKFQPSKYDEIATSDYEWYSVYIELFFNKKQWNEILNYAYKTKDIWIDLFDEYGIEIINENIGIISGIKLQTSILDNDTIYKKLKLIDLSNIKVIINIAGRDKEDISELISKFNLLNANELILEVGFQSYPTKLEDSGLSKIKYLKEKYSNKVIFADHIDGKDEDAILLPLIAMMNGADFIEKHIMHSSLKTKYDYFSSITIDRYKELVEKQKNYLPLLSSPFLNEAEKNYLKKSYQIPILNKKIPKLNLINLNEDLKFRRSNMNGLTVKEISKLISNYHVINKDKDSNTTIKSEDFKRANIAAIIACRLKSTRLKNKALLKIGDLSSIELCIKNTMRFSNLNYVVLATSDNEQDSELLKYIYDESVVFHQGDPEDVIRRYIDVIDKLRIDVVVRITGDMPYVSSEIFDFMLASHFKIGADYTVAKEAAVGMNLEIINSNALRKVKEYFLNAEYSEYMTWYFQNNPEHFKLNFVDLPEKWIRTYRLTLDYKEDLELFRKIEEYFKSENIDYSIDNLFNFLDNNPEIACLNSHLTLKYKTDKQLIDTLNKETRIKL